MDLYEAMSTLRAVRRLRPDPIDDAIIERVLTAATWAPTGGNTQPWRIVALTDADKKQALQDLYKPHWDSYLPGYEARLSHMPEDARASSIKAMDAGNYLAAHMHEAPLIAVFCFNPKLMTITDSELDRPSVVGGGSVYPAVQNFLLACRNEGLGCVLTTLLCYEEAAVKELLGMPEDWYPCAHIPVGYPVLGGHGSIRRRALDQMVRYNQW
ncbi:MAG: oxidoreductase [Proteobacteria bacterium]|jgi:nitroreductase|nr:oxidoreductase [Pseudomonadota bacterium]